MMSTVHTDAEQERLLIFAKGAPDVLLARCSQELVGEATRPIDDGRRREILAANDALASQALRTLGVAYRVLPADALDGAQVDDHFEHDLVFAGLVGMIDPPRDEAREAVARARQAGIRPMMITGDHPRTAAVIAEALGIAAGQRHDHRRGARGLLRRGARGGNPQHVGLRASESRAQTAHRQGAAGARGRSWR